MYFGGLILLQFANNMDTDQTAPKHFSCHSPQLLFALSSAYVLWWPIIANTMDPDQTAPLGAV